MADRIHEHTQEDIDSLSNKSVSYLPEGVKLRLFVDDSPDSVKAARLLRQSGLPYVKTYASGIDLPAVKLGDTTYPTLFFVRNLVRALKPITD